MSAFKSSLIDDIKYNAEDERLIIFFCEKYFKKFEVYYDIPQKVIIDWLSSDSLGKFYLNNIQSKFKTSKTMDKIIQVSIDLTKINKTWLIKGENARPDGSFGIYLNATILYNEKQDAYGQNGFIVQKVPKELRETVKNGPILGNIKEFERIPRDVVTPGEAVGTSLSDEIEEDLPF